MTAPQDVEGLIHKLRVSGAGTNVDDLYVTIRKQDAYDAAAALAALAQERDKHHPVAGDTERLLEIGELRKRAEQAERERDEAREDAERYRTARSRAFGIARWTEFAKPLVSYEEAADAAIDAARKASDEPRTA